MIFKHIKKGPGKNQGRQTNYYEKTPKYFRLAMADPHAAQPFYNSLSKESLSKLRFF